MIPGFVFAREDLPNAAQARIDSLQRLIDQSQLPDSKKMEVLLDMAWAIRSSNPTLALDYARQGLAIAEDHEYPDYVIRALVDIGLLYWRMGNFNMAYDFFLEARQLAEREGDLYQYARVLSAMGIIFSGQGHYDNALEHNLRALSIYEEIDSVAATGSVLNNIGLVYQRQGNMEMAETYHRRSLQVKEHFGDEQGRAFSLNNLGAISQHRGDYQQALIYYNESLAIREEFQETREVANTLRNIGYLHYKKGEYDRAIDQLNEALSLLESVEDDRGVGRVYYHLGEVHMGIGNLIRAQRYFTRSLQIAEEIGLPSLVSDNLEGLGQLMAMQGEYQQAYDYQGRYMALQDSIYDEESRRRVIELQLMYDRERKEREIELLRISNQVSALSLEKQRLLRNFLLVVVLLILVLLFVIYNRFLVTSRANRLLKRQKEEISVSNKKLQELNRRLLEQKQKVEELYMKLKESEKNLIEINKTKDKFFSIISHDLRNPFASIVSFSRILKRDIDQLSKDELQQLTLELDKSVLKINSLLENLLQWSRAQTGKISYQPGYFEIKDIIRDNINLFSAGLQEKGIEITDKVKDHLIVWGDVNMTNTIIRNLLSNALKYTKPGGYIELRSEKKNDMVEVEVADNGIGISASDQKKLFRVDTLHTTYGTRDEKGSGLGLLLCKEFVEKQGGQICLKSHKGQGSVFSFTIPLSETSS